MIQISKKKEILLELKEQESDITEKMTNKLNNPGTAHSIYATMRSLTAQQKIITQSIDNTLSTNSTELEDIEGEIKEIKNIFKSMLTNKIENQQKDLLSAAIEKIKLDILWHEAESNKKLSFSQQSFLITLQEKKSEAIKEFEIETAMLKFASGLFLKTVSEKASTLFNVIFAPIDSKINPINEVNREDIDSIRLFTEGDLPEKRENINRALVELGPLEL